MLTREMTENRFSAIHDSVINSHEFSSKFPLNKVYLIDCIKMMQSIPDSSVQMVFADPPFNLNKKYNSYKDNLDFEKYMEWTREYLTQASRVLRDDGSLFLYNIPKLLTFTTAILNELLEFRHWISWNSNGRPLGKTLQPAHYGILYYTKSRNSKFYDIRTPHEKCRKCDTYTKDYGGKSHLRHPFGYQLSDVWNDIHRSRHRKDKIDNHPCQLPPHLIERMILMTTDPGDLVLDLFAGGGSAGVATKQMGRNYLGCDIDKTYVKASNSKIEDACSCESDGKFISRFRGKIVTIRSKDL